MNDAVDKTGSLDDFLAAPVPSRKRKWAIRGGIAAAALLLLWLVVRSFSGTEQAGYATVDAVRGDLTVTVSATGNLKPVNQVDVGSEQSGLITQVLVDVNDRVTRGQVLAMLDTSRLQDTVRQGEAQVKSAQAQVAQARAQAALANATLARQQEVYRLSGGRVPSKTEMDSARAEVATARANVEAALAAVGVAQATLSTARINLGKARIVSPVDGVVLSRDIEPGQTVAASFNAPVLFTLAEDLKKMEVEVSVDEADVGQVQAGQSATFTVDAFPGRAFPAKITRVNVGSNSSGSSSSSSSSTSSSSSSTVVSYTAMLSVDNRTEILRPGMTATADIVAQTIRHALLIPNAALRFTPPAATSGGSVASSILPRPRSGSGSSQQVGIGTGSRRTIYVLEEGGRLRPVSVVVGESDGTRTVVTGGDLKPGMKVVTAQLAPGKSDSSKGASRTSGNAG